MNGSIRLKLFSQAIGIVFIIIVIIVFFVANFLEDFYIWSEKQNLKSAAQSIDTVEQESSEISSFTDIMNKVDTKQNMTIVLYAQNGKVYLYNNFIIAKRFGKYDDAAALKVLNDMIVVDDDNNEDGSYYQIREESIVDNPQQQTARRLQYLVYGCRLKSGNSLEILIPKESMETSSYLTIRFLLIISIAAVIFSVPVAIMFSRRFTDPLLRITKVTKNMANLDFTQKCYVDSDDEIGDLSKSINALSDSLNLALEDLRDKNIRLEQDIEKERELDQQRKDLISNLSHELKTPIAIIQGFAEGLQMNVHDDPERREEYCRIIIDESNKMNKMVLELLQLSKYEHGQTEFNRDRINITKLIEGILNNYQIKLAENGIKVYNLFEKELFVNGDVFKIEQVINNYLNNAISHTKPGGEIKVGVEELDSFYRISVFNTGEHIDKSDLPKIWNNFYRVDKAHKREQNRVGLGLSIVKAIQDMHGCAYGVENVTGGVRFWFDALKDAGSKALVPVPKRM